MEPRGSCAASRLKHLEAAVLQFVECPLPEAPSCSGFAATAVGEHVKDVARMIARPDLAEGGVTKHLATQQTFTTHSDGWGDGRQPVERTDDRAHRSGGDLRIEGSGVELGVTEQRLHDADIDTIFK